MTVDRYCAPESVAEAVALLDPATGAAAFAGGTDLLVQMRAAARSPATIVDLKRIPGTGRRGVRAGRGAHRRGDALRRADRERRAACTVAGPAGGRRPDRFHAGAGARQPRRQPVQRLARRGLGAGAGGQSRAGPDRGARRPAQRCRRGLRARAGAHRARQRRVRARHRVAAPGAAHRGCLPALHAAHRDGYRGGRRGSIRDAGRRRCMHRCAHRAGRGRAHGAAGARGRRGADRLALRRRGAGSLRRPPRAPRHGPSPIGAAARSSAAR